MNQDLCEIFFLHDEAVGILEKSGFSPCRKKADEHAHAGMKIQARGFSEKFRHGGRCQGPVLSGPEGGLSPAEEAAAAACGFAPVTLGLRVLRSETAALTALARLLA